VIADITGNGGYGYNQGFGSNPGSAINAIENRIVNDVENRIAYDFFKN
jgi:hypothetical protein